MLGAPALEKVAAVDGGGGENEDEEVVVATRLDEKQITKAKLCKPPCGRIDAKFGISGISSEGFTGDRPDVGTPVGRFLSARPDGCRPARQS